MAEYRWNQSELAAGYDAGAPLVHPYYVEVQDVILDALPLEERAEGLLVDLGGGSGRLMERVLERWPRVRGLIVDQSAAFLDLARERLARFGERAALTNRRLQDDWRSALSEPAAAFVSMSAIHHLDRQEKQDLAARCFASLGSGGVFLNGDEVRPERDADYLAELRSWAAHMDSLIEGGRVTPAMAEALRGWKARNVERFGEPKSSGDDCHQTAAEQLEDLSAAGFTSADVLYSRGLWSVLFARRA